MKAILSDRAIIAVSGAEARTFLQGVITNDIGKLAPGTPLYAALLTPQGKILFDFLLFERDGTILLDCARETADALQKRLTMYRLRAKIDIARRDDLAVIATWNGNEDALRDPRLDALGSRAVGARDAAELASDDYTQHRLDLGVPEGKDFGQDEMFALDADLEELHGVSFDKGCYVGQELTARMKHRGTARKRLLAVAAMSGALPARGARISVKGSDVGAITSNYGSRGFALIRLDRLAAAEGARLESDGTPVSVKKPSWLSY